MEDFFNAVGRPALFETLDKTFGQFDHVFRSEIESLRARASEAEKLELENKSLQAENLEFRKAQQSEGPGSNIRHPLAPRTANETPTPKHHPKSRPADDEFSMKLSLPELRQKYVKSEAARKKLETLLRDKLKYWKDYSDEIRSQSDKRLEKIKKLEAKVAALTSELESTKINSTFGSASVPPQDSAFARPLKDTEPTLPPLNHHAEASALSDGESTQGLPSSEPSRASKKPTLPPLPDIDNNAASQMHIKAEPSSDPPIIVSERPVKRKRHGDTHDRQISPPRRIKHEDSSPVVTDTIRHFAAHESIDFDAEASRVETPRKHRVISSVPQTVSTINWSRNPGYGPALGTPRQSELSDGRTGADQRHTRNPPGTTLANTRERTSALSPLGPSLQPRTRLETGSIIKPSEYSPRRIRIASLAEDGDEGVTPNVSRVKNKRQRTGNHLNDLLDSPSPWQSTAAIPSITQPANAASKIVGSFATPPARRDLPFGNRGDSSKNAHTTPSHGGTSDAPINSTTRLAETPVQLKKKSNEKAPANPTTAKKSTKNSTAAPLRSKSLSELRIDDFKVNPNANEGLDYAFTDVYRSRDERAALKGCTRESCCGESFRVVAESLRPTVKPAAFTSLLESYLGDDCHRLASMSAGEKERLWVEAKVHELADRHGRHRHRYQRMPSPPGFWRTDFPSTQEGEEDRLEAEKMERQTVEERYREAMRNGGLWLFRDEAPT